MITLIIGRKGSGKTKKLIETVDRTVESSNGNVVCVEKNDNLRFDINYRARLIETDLFKIDNYEAFYGLLCGICSGDHDITDILVDATLKIGGKDLEKLGEFLKRVNDLGVISDKRFTFTISADKEELPEYIFDFCKIA